MANLHDMSATIDRAWDARAEVGVSTKGEVRAAIDAAIGLLDGGEARVAERDAAGRWVVHQWLKKAVLLSFRCWGNRVMEFGDGRAFDKAPLKFEGWRREDFERARFRVVPGAVVRRGAYIAPSAVLMPSFVNIGAHIGEGAMIDAWATVGSCAQIGARCHISGGAGIGGVLEPLQAGPVVIEDDCFIGARSEVAEGVIVRRGSVLSMGVYLGASTKIVDRATGAVFYGEVPPYSVVVAGALPAASGPSLYCAVIVKRVDERTRAKTAINDLLRD
jgi:2,3,4,5-tetrahydropyridine-2-carboxylate N-succinyltransferase